MTDPRPAASVLPVRPSAAGDVEALVIRRALGLAYLAGFDSLPSGRVEAADATLPMDLVAEDAAERGAALRELFEEVGILALTAGALPEAESEALRRETIGDAAAFGRHLRARGLTLAASRLQPLGDFLTPGYTRVRFRSRFYALPVPAGTLAAPLDAEIAEARWVRPGEALARQEAGELALTYLTLEPLRRLHERGLAAPAEPYPYPGGEMLAGVHLLALRSATLPPSTHTNTYILGGEEAVVVDPAPTEAAEREALLAYVRERLPRGARVVGIWLTHHHVDHVGAAEWLRERTGAPVLAHPWTAAALRGEVAVDGTLDEGSERVLEAGGRRATWRTLVLPGHCPGHLGFYEPERGTLVAGDLLAGEGTVLVAPPEGDMHDYLASLERLLGMPLGFVFPGHGPPTGAGHALVRAYVEHRREREHAILDTLARAGEPLAPVEIVPAVYTDVPEAAWGLAAGNVLAHLRMLVREGRAREEDGRYLLAGT